ncbi:MAG: hypothetical protein AB1440_19645 [Pseudomonadota bacterium]
MLHRVGMLLALVCVLALGPLHGALADETPNIVGPLPNVTPTRSIDHDPNPQALIETWLGGSIWPKTKRFDRERYEILTYRVLWGRTGRAIMALRLLPLHGDTNADAVALAAKRCPGRKSPIDIQIYFEWSTDINSWVALDERGDPGFDACPSGTTFWRDDQLAKLVDPPPLPVPPQVAPDEVVTPAPGSPDRTALLDAVRPIYENMFGKPIQFRVETMRVAAGFAYMSVHPQRPNGSPIERKAWNKAVRDCWQTPESVTHEYWMRKVGDTWRVGLKNQFCADDSISGEGDIIGAPPQLVQKDRWEERTTYPVNAIETGSF